MKRGVVQNYGPSGLAEVTVLAKVVRAKLLDQNVLYEFQKENCPETIRSGKFRIGISEDGQKIMWISPNEGKYLVKFEKFSAQRDQLPVPVAKTKPQKDRNGNVIPGQMRNWLEFRGIVEILEGPNKGMTYSFPLTYREKTQGFFPDEEGNLMVAGRGKIAEILTQFLTATGAFDKVIRHTDNVLPTLEETIKALGRPFYVTIEKGFAKSFEASLVKAKAPTAKKK